MRRIDSAERRARLARRHRLTEHARADDVVEAARSVVCLHGTDPVTVYLSAWARMEAMTRADMDRALYDERSLVKHIAMRRTLWIVPRETLPLVQAGGSERVAAAESRRLARDVERAGLAKDGERWLAGAWDAVLEALADGREATTPELREELPILDARIVYGEGKSWGAELPVGPRVLTTLSATGRVLRTSNAGGWRSSRPRYALTEAWLGEEIQPPATAVGVAGLVERWLGAFGPGTVEDIKWWLGSTMTAVRGALADLGAVEVDLDGRTGYLLASDLEPEPPVEPWAALLPSLDPATMGWLERDWYLGPHRDLLFDRNANAGHTAWWDGHVVGGWRQDASGEVTLQLLEDVGREGAEALEREAARLTEWFGGEACAPMYPSPLSKAPER